MFSSKRALVLQTQTSIFFCCLLAVNPGEFERGGGYFGLFPATPAWDRTQKSLPSHVSMPLPPTPAHPFPREKSMGKFQNHGSGGRNQLMVTNSVALPISLS